MTSLESIVLPLTESRALAEAGIVLDTALVWVYVKDANGRIVLTVIPREDAAADCLGADCDGQKVICGAPVLSELLDAIRGDGRVKMDLSVDWYEDGHVLAFGAWDIFAAYALLMGVAESYGLDFISSKRGVAK
jgi:hypothetical protein